jgi:hypothetical protein
VKDFGFRVSPSDGRLFNRYLLLFSLSQASLPTPISSLLGEGAGRTGPLGLNFGAPCPARNRGSRDVFDSFSRFFRVMSERAAYCSSAAWGIVSRV